MRSKFEWKRITIPVAMSVLMSSILFAVPAQSAAGAPNVTVRMSNANPSASATIHITVCWTNAQKGDAVELDEQSTSTLLWKAVSHETVSTAKGCEPWARSSGAIGNYPYRAEVRAGKKVVGTSAVALERTFGTISAALFFEAEWGCQGGGTVSTGTQSYSYFCSLSAGPKAQSDYLAFTRPSTCRTLTLSMVGTGDAKGNPADNSSIVVEIQQDNLVQPAIFTDNQLENFTYHLTKDSAALNIWDSPGNSDGDYAFFLTKGSTANCSSRTGV
jgi:hypothetical protein